MPAPRRAAWPRRWRRPSISSRTNRSAPDRYGKWIIGGCSAAAAIGARRRRERRGSTRAGRKKTGRLVVARRPFPIGLSKGEALLPPFFFHLPPLAVPPLREGKVKPWFDPQAGWPSHLVRPFERCESDRVADRPFALHPEAQDRGGRSTRLASSVRAGVITRITECLSPWLRRHSPLISRSNPPAGRHCDSGSQHVSCRRVETKIWRPPDRASA